MSARTPERLELVCPAGTPAALRVAVRAGADSVYVGFRDETNARNFPGLNFSREELAEAVAFAHEHGVRVFVAVNTFPRAGEQEPWHRAVDDALALGADALILADLGLARYARRRHPEARLHLSVQASAANPEAIALFRELAGIRRVVLPRVLTLGQIRALTEAVDVETEVFVLGGLCVMAEGRCLLSSYVTGRSPNMNGVCSPAEEVRYEEGEGGTLVTRLGPVTVNRFAPGEPAGYPTLCKGRFLACGRASYLFEEPVSLSALEILPDLARAGVRAVKIEGRQRGRAYIEKVIRTVRAAAEAVAEGRPVPATDLHELTEGGRGTVGAYDRRWR